MVSVIEDTSHMFTSSVSASRVSIIRGCCLYVYELYLSLVQALLGSSLIFSSEPGENNRLRDFV